MAESNDTKKIALKKKAAELTDSIMESEGIFWPEMGDLINNKIIQLELKNITPKTHYSQWSKYHNGDLGSRMTTVQWSEFVLTLQSIKKDFDEMPVDVLGQKKTIHDILIKSKRITDDIKYGVFINNQDTVIPKFFEPSYKQKLPNIKFIYFNDWNEGLMAFKQKKVDVALRDFATTVAFNSQIDSSSPLFFWPFFSFDGHFIVIKVSALKSFAKRKGLLKHSFTEDFTILEKEEFLKEQKIVVEGRTDFEWAAGIFCKQNNCENLKSIKDSNFVYYNTNKGKDRFINRNDLTVYCTNPIHAIDFISNPLYELIPLSNLLNHKNYNGLICTEETYKLHTDAIIRLIKTWFYDIEPFKEEITALSLPKVFAKGNQNLSYTIENLLAHLRKVSKATISPKDLHLLYEHSNFFYTDADVAFKTFYHEVLNEEDGTAITNYCEIAKVQLNDDSIELSALENVIRSIKESMIKL